MKNKLRINLQDNRYQLSQVNINFFTSWIWWSNTLGIKVNLEKKHEQNKIGSNEDKRQILIIKESTSSMAKCQLIIKDFTATCLDLPVPIPLAFFIYFQGAILWWKWKIMCPPDKSRSTKSWVCKIKREMMTYHQYRSKLWMLSFFYTLAQCLAYRKTTEKPMENFPGSPKYNGKHWAFVYVYWHVFEVWPNFSRTL